VGMAAIHHTDSSATVRELGRLFGVRLDQCGCVTGY
jgi:hypothetical protein